MQINLRIQYQIMIQAFTFGKIKQGLLSKIYKFYKDNSNL